MPPDAAGSSAAGVGTRCAGTVSAAAAARSGHGLGKRAASLHAENGGLILSLHVCGRRTCTGVCIYEPACLWEEKVHWCVYT